MDVNKIIKIILYTLMGISALMAIAFYIEGPSLESHPPDSPPIMGNIMIIWAYVLIVIGILLSLAFPLIQIVKEPKQGKTVLIGVGSLVLIFVISYFIAGGEEYVSADKELMASSTVSKLSGAGLVSFVILGAIAIGTIIYVEISKSFK